MNRREFIGSHAAVMLSGLTLAQASGAKAAAVAAPADGFEHRFATVNGIKMHYVEAGKGPLVILLHGFPLIWYSWRKQIPALAAAGYRVVVPDQRGYGQTEAPGPVRAYNITQLVGDVAALVGALGEREAVVVGWDWGSHVAWQCALMRPDVFRGVAGFSNPFAPRAPIRPSVLWKNVVPGKVFYQDYFQAEGVADREMSRDTKHFLRCALYSLSADAPPQDQWGFAFAPNTSMLDTLRAPKQPLAWLSEADLAYYASAYIQSGFTPALNWYRNIEFNWEITPYLHGAKVRQPALFVAGEEDPGIKWGKFAFDQLASNVPNLRKKVLIPGAAHLAPEEQPAAVNAALIEFLNGL